MPVKNHTRQTARRLLTTRMALVLGFGVLLTLFVLSGINAVHVVLESAAAVRKKLPVSPRRRVTKEVQYADIADTIASVNQQQLLERDHLLFQMIAMAAMFLCGLALAFASALHILRLERQTLAHLKEVARAGFE